MIIFLHIFFKTFCCWKFVIFGYSVSAFSYLVSTKIVNAGGIAVPSKCCSVSDGNEWQRRAASVGETTAADMANGLELELLGRQISSSRQRQHNMKYAYGITYRRYFVRTGNGVYKDINELSSLPMIS